MYVFFNNNPKGLKIGDCVVRAISAAMSKSWEQVYVDLCVEGYELRDMPNANAVWDTYLRENGYVRHSIPDTCPACYTIGQFAADHPQGTYIVATGTHVVCVRNAEILDNWDSSSEIPAYYYSKE